MLNCIKKAPGCTGGPYIRFVLDFNCWLALFKLVYFNGISFTAPSKPETCTFQPAASKFL